MNREYQQFIIEYFVKNKIDIGPYTSRNIIKRYIFLNRLYISLDIMRKNFDDKSLITDFGCGQGIFSIMLKVNGFGNVIGIDKNLDALHQANGLVYDFNKKFNTKYKIEFDSKMIGYNKIDTICALDVFEHFTKNDLELLISNIDARNYLLSLPTENFIYNFLNGFKREKDHQIRYYDVINILSNHGYDIKVKKSNYGLFLIYLLSRD